MLLLWDLYWPILAAALAIGTLAGVFAFREGAARRRKVLALAGGFAAAFIVTALWHGPAGTAADLRVSVETTARTTLDYYEMNRIEAGLQSSPAGRTLLLAGEADDFQRSELIRILRQVPGVVAVQWKDSGDGESFPLPLLLEVELWSLLVFGLGLLLAYLIEVRRRARAEWRW